jgi:hypothetical protein
VSDILLYHDLMCDNTCMLLVVVNQLYRTTAQDINQLYRTTVREKYYVNPTIDGMLSWRSNSYCALDSNTRLENCKQRLHELSTRICARIMCTLRWVGTEVREPPTFYGQNDLEEFLRKFELEFFESHRLPVLDISLKATPACWWGTHKEKILNWYQ